jgi:hypothetical protein
VKPTERIGLSEKTYDIDLTPPPEPRTILEELAEWGVDLTWHKPDEYEGGLWYLTNTYTDNLFDDWAIGHIIDDAGLLTSRDREAATILINKELEADDIQLRQSAWEPTFGAPYHGDRYHHAGPAIDVKLHAMWEQARQVEKALDIDFTDVDPEGTIQWDTVEWELEWFKDTYLPENYPDLNPDQFGLYGRQGGHLVYHIYSADYDAWPLTLAEATQLSALFDEIPELVKGVAMQVTARLGGYLLHDLWNLTVDEWRDGEEDAKAEAIRTKDFVRAAWHQANLDAETEWFDHTDGEEIIWDIIYKEDE